MLASSSALMNASSRPRAACGLGGGHRPGAGLEVLLGVSRRFFGSGEGSMTEQMAPKQ